MKRITLATIILLVVAACFDAPDSCDIALLSYNRIESCRVEPSCILDSFELSRLEEDKRKIAQCREEGR